MKLLLLVLLLLLALLQYRLWVRPGGLAEVRRLEQTKQELLEENARLKERNEALTVEVLDLKRDVEAVEEVARSEMGMIKSGEVFYRIIDEAGGVGPSASSPEMSRDAP